MSGWPSLFTSFNLKAASEVNLGNDLVHTLCVFKLVHGSIIFSVGESLADQISILSIGNEDMFSTTTTKVTRPENKQTIDYLNYKGYFANELQSLGE